MIYFDKKTRDELILKFYKFLKPKGYLIIGHSETVSREISPYKFVKPSIYMKE